MALSIKGLARLVDKNTMEVLAQLDKMENPDIILIRPKNYEYKGKKWDLMILIRDQKKLEKRAQG